MRGGRRDFADENAKLRRVDDEERRKRLLQQQVREPAVTQKPPMPPMTERIPGPVHVPFPRHLDAQFSYDALRQTGGANPGQPPVRRRAHEATYPSAAIERPTAPPQAAHPHLPPRNPFTDEPTLDRHAIQSAAEEAAFDTFIRVNLDVTVGKVAPSIALARYGLTLAQKLDLDARFRDKMRTDQALAQRYMRAAAEYALKMGG